MPRMHERSLPVKRAGLAVTEALEKIRTEHDLTDIEFLQILVAEQASIHKYMLRYERHGDYETPAEWAAEED